MVGRGNIHKPQFPHLNNRNAVSSLSGPTVKMGADSVDFDLAGGSEHWDADTFRHGSCQSPKEVTRDLGIWTLPQYSF